ncbi:CMRF35-like molecule 6 isoform X2 [Octodon degus]|uniref:CMRF35-like molecule 6 isoform X2 n=1 Tax=Octodon degus TaxID=10160 RepID=A0A6P6ECL1_OCTDE|nr:CMRF35-like molecule 6 isoform X2 [Octodon degus]
MLPGDKALWLPSALLLLQVPGCFLLSGPSTVTGTVGGSLSVQCWYEEHYKMHVKYWCKQSFITCDKIVETDGSEREVRNGRVTIRDHPANLSFTVTLENLALQDAGSYGCGVTIRWQENPTFRITVLVLPETATTTASHLKGITSAMGPSLSMSVHTWPSTTREDTSSPSPQPRKPDASSRNN